MAPIPCAAADYTFQTLNNGVDPTFNQLLGINNTGTIAGYFGAGSAEHPNKGYTLAPPYTQASYTNENFPNSVQTQVVGINSNSSPTTVGFWVDGNANNFGFIKQGDTFTSVSNPNTPAAGTLFNQLLGVNSSNVAVGFYTDANGNNQGYSYDIAKNQFNSINLPGSFSATMTTATGINNSGIISGFYVDATGNTHGFLDSAGNFTSLDDPNGTNTMLLGLNNGQVVGSFVDANGMTNGLLYDLGTKSWLTLNDPNSSAMAAFDVTGTTINGINDRGQLVGFYSDGTNVDGFLATPAPEPASVGFMLTGMLVCGLAWRNKLRRS